MTVFYQSRRALLLGTSQLCRCVQRAAVNLVLVGGLGVPLIEFSVNMIREIRVVLLLTDLVLAGPRSYSTTCPRTDCCRLCWL